MLVITNHDHVYHYYYYITGWWFEPLWKILVNWDDDIPNIWENKIDVPSHQPDFHCCYYQMLEEKNKISPHKTHQ